MNPLFLAKSFTFALIATLAPIAAHAQSSPTTSASRAPAITDDILTLDALVVSGVAPGPGMWRVFKESGHEIWILGTLSPIPAAIDWDSKRAESIVADAQEVLWHPYYAVDVKAGFFKKIALGYGMYRAKQIPDGRSLKHVLDPDVYARWAQLKARYLPRDRGVERSRPQVAADALLNAAIQQAGLSKRRIVNAPVLEAIKANGVTSTTPAIIITLSNATAKSALADVRRESLNDAACMEATLDAIEQDLPRMITNANAWAIGDLERINFTQLERRARLCSDALTDGNFARAHGLPNIRDSIMTRWMVEAESALQRNRVTVTIAPLEHILHPNGYIARLRARGYNVENP